MRNYTVSKDSKSGMWYAHHKDFPNIPVCGSICKKKSEANEYAKMMDWLPNRVQQIEDKKHEEIVKMLRATGVWEEL